MTSELVAGRWPHYHHTDLLSGRSPTLLRPPLPPPLSG